MSSSSRAQSPHVTGRWSNLFQIDGAPSSVNWTGVHAALLRGNCDTALVLHFLSDATARVLRIPPDSALIDPASVATTPTATPSWTALNLQASAASPPGGIDLFCGGHASLGDGRLLVASGTEKGVNGHRLVRLFDPMQRYGPGRGWSDTDSLKVARWYPSPVTTGTGTVLAFSGLRAYEQFTFGGQKSAAALFDSSVTTALERDPYWGPHWPAEAAPMPGDPAIIPPGLRDAAVAFSNDVQLEVSGTRGVIGMFGGRSADGATPGTPSNEFWVAARAGFHDHDRWVWRKARADDVAPRNGYVTLPTARSEHAMVAAPDAPGDTAYFYIYGGRGAGTSPTVYGDVWLLRYYRTPETSSNFRYYVTQIATTGNSPGARYGHVMVYDPGPLDASSTPTDPRLLIYGGKTTGGALADNKVYALRLTPDANGTYAWFVAQGAAPGDSVPPARYRSRGVFIPSNTGIDGENAGLRLGRMFVFGGEGATDATRYKDLWRLSRLNKITWNPDVYTWRRWTPGYQTYEPSARSGHTLIWGFQWRRLLLDGGRAGAGPIDTLVADSWFVPVDHGDTCTSTGGVGCERFYWRRANDPGSPPPGREGHMASYYNVPFNVREPELYDPGAPAGSRWSLYPAAAAKHHTQETYPFMFLLPSGNVFEAGRETRQINGTGLNDFVSTGHPTAVFRPEASTWGAPKQSDFEGSSAVMYAPGKVMKLGDFVAGDNTLSRTKVIDLGTSESIENAATWSDQTGPTEVFRRVEPNLVLLPTGNVLAVGGRIGHENFYLAEKRPQIWSAAAKSWVTPPMAEQPSTRGYHSTALLLPDARVMSLGGNSGSTDPLDQAEVFEPPYLFDLNAQSQEVYAARPKILTAPAVIQPGTPFTITTDRPATLVSAALVRPGATTHAFDQNQRFVPCALQRIGTTSSVQITPTSNSNELPPGDWMLFLVDNVSPNATTVPSRAAWVRVGGTSGPEPTTVSDLQVVDYACTWAELHWSAPRPDAGLSCGKATEYEIRYKTSPMNDLNSFQTGTPVPSPPTPDAPGTLESVTLSNLQETATYYVRMRAKNAAGLWSALSNQVSFTMWQCGGSGGGGDPGDQLPGPNAMLSTNESDTTYLENTLFARLGRYERRTDRLRLPYGPKWSGDTARVRVSRSGAGGLHVHAVRLVALDHASADDAFAAETGPVPASRLLPTSVTHVDGRDLTAALASGAQPFEGHAGDILRVQFGSSASGRTFLRASRPDFLAVEDTMGIDVNVLQSGAWQTIARVSPRELESDEVVALPAHSELQLVFLGTHRLHGLGRLAAPAEAGSVTALAPVAATHSVRGDAMTELSAGDVPLAGGEHLTADFLPPAAIPGRERTWFLEVKGEESWSASRPGGEGRSRPEGGTSVLAFALHASRPNPTRAGVVIPFDLPRTARVELEVFDLLGRRVHRQVATLAAGHHELAWSLIGERGMAVPTGMYAYRLTAGTYRAQRKMVVVR